MSERRITPRPRRAAGRRRRTPWLEPVTNITHRQARGVAALAPKFGASRGLQAALQVLEVMRSRQLPGPNIDFALAALARSAHMIHGASEGIMAIARSAGWIAHALEEYRAPSSFPWQTLTSAHVMGQPRVAMCKMALTSMAKKLEWA